MQVCLEARPRHSAVGSLAWARGWSASAQPGRPWSSWRRVASPSPQVTRLDKMGVEWTGLLGQQWERMWKHLEAFVNKYGNAHVPQDAARVQASRHRGGVCGAAHATPSRAAVERARGEAWQSSSRWGFASRRPNPNFQKKRKDAKRRVMFGS